MGLRFFMDSLPTQDVREIVRLLGEVAVLNAELPAKRRFLLEGLAKLIGADAWFWAHFKPDPGKESVISFMFVDGGWESEEQRMKTFAACTSEAYEPLNTPLRKGRDVHRTYRRVDLVPDEQWYGSELCEKYYHGANFGDILTSLYPLGDDYYSSIAFLRQLGRAQFDQREVCIAHVVMSEIDWLHRGGVDVPAKEHVNKLSNRQRQVLLQLLSGDSVKQIAQKLSLSAFTVNGHLKTIYERFHVSSRGELLAQFLAGGPVNNRV
jgi:DNA-binding CsgD family transcriptional regulator